MVRGNVQGQISKRCDFVRGNLLHRGHCLQGERFYPLNLKSEPLVERRAMKQERAFHVRAFQSEIGKNGLDVAVLVSREWDPNVAYLSGYGGAGWLVVPSRKDPFLVVPKMEVSRAVRSGIEAIEKKGGAFDSVLNQLKSRTIKMKNWGIVSESIGWSTAEKVRDVGVRIRDVSHVLEKIRQIKTKNEIRIIKRGCELTDIIFKKACRKWGEFRTECDVAAFLEFWAKKYGCNPSFPTIIASGKNAGIPHHETSMGLLQNGFCIIDWGVRCQGYCSDMSRTVCIGAPSGKMEREYDTVLDSQHVAIDAVGKGVACKRIDEVARERLGELNRLFIHGLGHGIGVEVHERPWINGKSVDVLDVGMCITIEPGIYSKGGGIRIEDDILVTDDGKEMLTKSPKDLLIVD